MLLYFLVSLQVSKIEKTKKFQRNYNMNISFSWLKEYIDTTLEPVEVANILTSIGLEVGHIEEYESIRGGLEGLVVGEVLTCIDHENSDHLHVTTVDIGADHPLQIVCGAKNVAAGQKVVVATVGTKLYQGDESFLIKRSKIRGVESFGMICAEDEIGVGSSHDGIIVLPQDTPVGTLAKDYYKVEKDTIIEVDITPNRADAVSHYGVARDLYAYCLAHGVQATLRRPEVECFMQDTDGKRVSVSVKNSEACPRYSGICIDGITVKESPAWLKNRLNSIGLRPINNIVDITNYLLHSFGEPLHAFDFDKIGGGEIVVRNAMEGEKFVTLDGIERSLSQDDLMICDKDKPMCLAGVFGGLHSGVTENTTTIFIESAYFNPVTIRKTARRHGLNTDSSFRFERGANPEQTLYVLSQAIAMVQDIAGGKISGDFVDIYPKKIDDFAVDLSLKKLYTLVGKEIKVEEVETILKGLEIQIVDKKSIEDDVIYSLKVPAYRVDVQRDVDVIEDILRIYGYNNVDFSDSLKSNISYRQTPDAYSLQSAISDQLTSCGYFEIMNNSLTKESYYDKCNSFSADKSVKILNPLSADLSVMRQTLLFAGLENIAFNINRQHSDIKFYEFGRCYSFNKDKQGDDSLDIYTENNRLAIWLSGNKQADSWVEKSKKTTVFDLKAQVENLLKKTIGAKKFTIEEVQNDIFLSAIIYSTSEGKSLVYIGLLNSNLLKQFDIKADVFYADIDFDVLVKESVKKKIRFSEIPKSPEVSRDLALLIDKSITFAQVEKLAFDTEKKLLKKVSLFDVYEGEKIGLDKKSYAVNFILQDTEKTLTDKQIEYVMAKLQKTFADKLGAEIR